MVSANFMEQDRRAAAEAKKMERVERRLARQKHDHPFSNPLMIAVALACVAGLAFCCLIEWLCDDIQDDPRNKSVFRRDITEQDAPRERRIFTVEDFTGYH